MGDNISLVETDKINGKIELVVRQTNYTPEQASEKLKEYNFDEIAVIKAYLGIEDKQKTTKKSINQEIYSQLRFRLDSNMRNYNERVERGEARKL